MLRVIILCAMGMSSSVITNAVRKAAEKRGIEIEIHCQPSLTMAEGDYTQADVILMAPQIKGQKGEIEEYMKGYKAKLGSIDNLDYALAKGDKVLDQCLKLLEEN